MNQIGKRNPKNIADLLFEEMDQERKGSLNLENMRKLYDVLPNEYKDAVR